ncbi:bifunctional phosphoribosyl-AMP cyclohydrolase/phosphoribosyl-ATP pyrophosphatase [Helicobacter sp. 13S00477-4]|nr:bifunctional phosphoribosyl-AMP cyclohydrolase/phosphoribosyl-ATP pyrophosphatase [Helicobacter sp. 13S00477-4]
MKSIIKRLDWEKSPLIPAIVQEYKSKDILMLGFMNPEAFELTLQTGFVHYFSRTRERIWKKGEKSGHTQRLIEVYIDCDCDTLLLKVQQEGNVCHTGRDSCFFQSIDIESGVFQHLGQSIDMSSQYEIVDVLYHTLQEKKGESPDKSYTASLYAKGDNAICKKIVEEAGEFAFAIKDNDKEQIIYECADLIYHTLVGLSHKNISPDLIRQELKRRTNMSGIEEKNSRKSND